MQTKLIFLGYLFVALFSAIGGYAYRDRVYSEQVVEQAEDDVEAVVELNQAEVKRNVEVIEKIKIVRQVVDECAVERMPDEFLGLLQYHEPHPEKPRVDG